jgi:hypothetical protein
MDYSLLLVYYKKPDDFSFEESNSDQSSKELGREIKASPGNIIPGNY